ncbi:hypothetical protein N7G274_006695 [Stereocaulon virgatum]|uniref:Putative gamma-glutamylcyclotransferase n=1 Tax=Stereocaulon virgatum TaxID=373712 RepID=A0ABR4A737_9LECA
MGDRSAFFYGTLMAPQVLHRVIYGTTTPTPIQISRLKIVPALLNGYMRHRVRQCDYPAIVPSKMPNACVRGTCVQGLSAEDLWRLDLFEGDQYDRVKVRPRLLDESGQEMCEIETETYVWTDKEVGLEEGEWDFEEFRREKMRRWVGGDDEEYQEVDEAVRESKDPTGGRGANGHITTKLEVKNKNEEGLLRSAV